MSDIDYDAYEPVDYSKPPVMVGTQLTAAAPNGGGGKPRKTRPPPTTAPKPASHTTYETIPPQTFVEPPKPKSPAVLRRAMRPGLVSGPRGATGNPPPLPTSQRPNYPNCSPVHTPPSHRPGASLKRPKSLDEGKLHAISKEPIEVCISLVTFMAKYGRSLPLRVRVDKGYYGSEDRNVISSGDVYNVHFLKKTKVVWIQDNSGRTFPIPLNSAVEFGLYYDPNNDFKEASKGILFPCVSDIVTKEPLPKVIQATADYDSTDPRTSVEKGEVLIVERAVRTGLRRRPALRVFSLHKNTEKTINEDCAGQFTTEPSSIRLYLPEILQHATEWFPIKALLYINMDTPDDFPRHLTSEVVTLTHSSIETSLIATTQWEESYTPSAEDKVPVDIPVDLDIEVTVLPTSGISSEEDQLCIDTKNLYEKFDPAKIKTTHSRMGSQFFKVVRSGHAREGLELQKPERIYEVPSVPRQAVRIRSSTRSESSSDGEKQSPTRFRSSPNPPEAIEKPPAVPERQSSQSTTGDTSKQLSQTQAEVRSLKTLVDRLSESTSRQISGLKDEVTRTRPTTDRLAEQLEKLGNEVTQLWKTVATLSANVGLVGSEGERHGLKTVSAEVQEQNRQKLLSYSQTQVLQLLEAMNLKQYSEKFTEEQIDGELLVECDAEVLESDLGVTRKLHRNRLIKVITGRHSAESIIKGEDPYVQLVH